MSLKKCPPSAILTRPIEIPKNILKDIEITPVSNVDEVLKIALTKELKPVEWIEVESLPKSKTGEKPVTGSTH